MKSRGGQKEIHTFLPFTDWHQILWDQTHGIITVEFNVDRKETLFR